MFCITYFDMSLLTASLADFNIAVDMTAANFEMHLPEVLYIIEHCDFIAFDLEFSGMGYKPYFRSVGADTVTMDD